jgi:hypothetical protein
VDLYSQHDVEQVEAVVGQEEPREAWQRPNNMPASEQPTLHTGGVAERPRT